MQAETAEIKEERNIEHMLYCWCLWIIIFGSFIPFYGEMLAELDVDDRTLNGTALNLLNDLSNPLEADKFRVDPRAENPPANLPKPWGVDIVCIITIISIIIITASVRIFILFCLLYTWAIYWCFCSNSKNLCSWKLPKWNVSSTSFRNKSIIIFSPRHED